MPEVSRRRTALIAAVTATPMLLVLAPGGTAAAVWGTSGCYAVDTVPPLVQSVTMTPTAIDTRTGAKKVHVTATATDSSPRNEPISGISSIAVQLWDPSAFSGHNLVSGALARSAGTTVDGTWTGDVTVPRWVSGGDAGSTWYLSLVVATDHAGNSNTYSTNPDFPSGTAPDDIAKSGWTKTITVQSTPDVSQPRITDFSFTPGAVDSTTKAQKVVVKAHATDTGSGVHGVNVSFVQDAPFHFAGAKLALVRGTRASGTWKGTVVVRTWSGNGVWHASLDLSDRIGNFRSYSYADLKTEGWKRNLTVTSGSESRPPRLRDLHYTPHTVDIRSAGQTVDVGPVKLRDRPSGVASAVVQFDGPAGFSFSALLHRTAGTARRGSWSGKARLPHCGPPPGTYKTSVFARDRAGNQRTYGAGKLHDMGLPSTLTVRAKTLDRTPPGLASDAYGNNSGPIVVAFSEDVTGVTTESIQLYDTSTFDPAAMTSAVCVDSSFQIVDCELGPVHQVTLQPAFNATPESTYYVYANQNGVDVQVRDLVGNPAPWEEPLGQAHLTSS
jgi:hypothetical protein